MPDRSAPAFCRPGRRRLRCAVALAAAALAGTSARAAVVPPPAETPVEIVVSGRTSTLKSIRIAKTGQSIPPNFSNGRVKNTPGYEWYVSRHYALKTNMSEDWARRCLTWAELAWPHAVWVIGREPDGLEDRRMVFVYSKSLPDLRRATFTDGGFRWQQGGGGVTFDFLKAAYNYPSGSLTYHKRDLVIHENLHLLQACATGSCDNMPFRFLEGVTYALANHVYDKDAKRLTVSVLDKPTVNNMYDNALRALAKQPRSIRQFLESDQTGPLVGLYTQFMWTDPDRLMKWRLWRDELLAADAGNLKANDARLMREIYGDVDRLDADWKHWVAARRSTFHYVDWGWEQVGETLWSYGWPQKTPFSQTNVNLPIGEPAAHDPLVMDYPAEPMPAHLVGPVRRGGAEPSVGAVLDFSRNPRKGLCGLAFGVIAGKGPRRPARLPADVPGQLNVYVEEARRLVMDGRGLRLKKAEAAIPDAVQAAMKADKHRVGMTVRVAADELRVTLRAGPAGAVKQHAASLALTPAARKRIVARPSAVIAKDGYHGVRPLFDAARKMPPDLARPAPPNRWRFPGEQATYRLYRAAWKMGPAAPASLLALKRRMAHAMDKEPDTQRAAMEACGAGLRKVVADVRAVRDDRLAQAGMAALLGLSLELQASRDAPPRVPKLVACLRGPADGRVRGKVTFRTDAGTAGPAVEVAAGRGEVATAPWSGQPTGEPLPFSVHARADLKWGGLDLSLSARRAVYPSVPRWWIIGPFDNRGDGTADTPQPPEREPFKADAEHEGKGRTVRWRKCERPGDLSPDAEHVVNFKDIYGGRNVAACALVWVESERATEAVLALGSDDGAVVWLNGRRVHRRLTARGYRSMEDDVPIRLRKGANKLLVKVAQGGGEWGFCAHLLDKHGAPLQGVKYVLTPPGGKSETRNPPRRDGLRPKSEGNPKPETGNPK